MDATSATLMRARQSVPILVRVCVCSLLYVVKILVQGIGKFIYNRLSVTTSTCKTLAVNVILPTNRVIITHTFIVIKLESHSHPRFRIITILYSWCLCHVAVNRLLYMYLTEVL